jgi:hypothetical protein
MLRRNNAVIAARNMPRRPFGPHVMVPGQNAATIPDSGHRRPTLQPANLASFAGRARGRDGQCGELCGRLRAKDDFCNRETALYLPLEYR